MRAARAVLGLSQTESARQIGLTQKSVHRIEQGAVEPKLRTRRMIEQFWRDSGIGFEDLPDGGFCITVQGPVLLRAYAQDRPCPGLRDRKTGPERGFTDESSLKGRRGPPPSWERP